MNDEAERLLAKLRGREAKLGVIGLGYVAAPGYPATLQERVIHATG